MLDGEKYGKFEEEIEASKTYGTMEENYPYQPNHMGVDNPGFQESSFTEYPNNQVDLSRHLFFFTAFFLNEMTILKTLVSILE